MLRKECVKKNEFEKEIRGFPQKRRRKKVPPFWLLLLKVHFYEKEVRTVAVEVKAFKVTSFRFAAFHPYQKEKEEENFG